MQSLEKFLNIDFKVSSIEIDSRKCTENSIFVAINGENFNGADFIDSAFKMGAKLIIIDKKEPIDGENILKVEDVRSFLSRILEIYYFKKLPENIVAITGTNGKSSIANFIFQIWQKININCAFIGTIGTFCSKKIDGIINSDLTSPDIITLYKNLALLKKNNIDQVVIEASSIGLDQERMGNLKFKIGGFSNLSLDHLDYHKNFTNYFKSKALLFEKHLSDDGVAILNADIKQYKQLKKICDEKNLKTIGYGYKSDDARIVKVVETLVEVEFFGRRYWFDNHFGGDFQIYNLICAILMVTCRFRQGRGKLIEDIVNMVDDLKPAKGRMEFVGKNKNGGLVYIDYAHTPDALENILKEGRKICKNRLLVLFGCGGDRDSKKRTIMGRIADQNADFIVVTDDNPRNEDPFRIRAEVILGIENKNHMVEIESRKDAIKYAIDKLENEDLLILAGKGHEQYQIIGNDKVAFDEFKIVREILSEGNS